jgi:hypothetical protein
MITPRPWRVGKQQADGTWCVVTRNHVAEGIVRPDDEERYGGSLIAKGLTLANARLVACAPDMHALLSEERSSGYCADCDETVPVVFEEDPDVINVLDRINTGLPV